MAIYVHHNNQQLGPFYGRGSRSQLAAGALSLAGPRLVEGPGRTGCPSAGSPVLGSPASRPGGLGRCRRIRSEPTGLSPFSIAALVAGGCLSFVCSLFLLRFPPSSSAIWRWDEIKKKPRRTGRGMALTGPIIGYVVTLLIVGGRRLLLLLSGRHPGRARPGGNVKSDIFIPSPCRPRHRRRRCATNSLRSADRPRPAHGPRRRPPPPVRHERPPPIHRATR